MENCLVFQVRIHGRGGQGVVTAAELLAQSAFDEKRFAQAFPSFGSERTGAPVVAFCRIADSEIRVREPIMFPDALIIQDSTLLRQVDVFAGLKNDGYALINSTRTFEQLGIADFVGEQSRFITVPATAMAMEHLGRPVPNAVLLGAFAALTQIVSLDSVTHAIRGKFKPKIAESNCSAATAAYEYVYNLVGSHA